MSKHPNNQSILTYLDARSDANRLMREIAFGDTPVSELAPKASTALATVAAWHRPHRAAARRALAA